MRVENISATPRYYSAEKNNSAAVLIMKFFERRTKNHKFVISDGVWKELQHGRNRQASGPLLIGVEKAKVATP